VSQEHELNYFAQPTGLELGAKSDCTFLSIAHLLLDEPACKLMWELVDTQFRTRSKFLAIWRTAMWAVIHRDGELALDGFLLISAPVNWQIDYVVVRPDSRGQGIASRLVGTAMNEAVRQGVPYVMLTSKASLRPLYESCGFRVVAPQHAILA
jgi:GNAT superfamily N-acetyltransferase